MSCARLSLTTVILLTIFAQTAMAEHAGITPQGERTPERELPDKPPNAVASTKAQIDPKNQNLIYLIYTANQDPVLEGIDYATASCNKYGYRLPNYEELEKLMKEGSERMRKKFLNAECLWSSSQKDKDNFYIYDTKGKGRYRASKGYKCATVCFDSPEPLKDIVEMCPVGGMNYCEKGQTSITTCEGKTCRADFDCICGDFALSFSRCLKNKMGKKSWSVYSNCVQGNVKGLDPHASNVIQLPYEHSEVINKFCAIEPQHVNPRSDPKTFTQCCWLQSTLDGAEPIMPQRCQKTYCPGAEVGVVKIHPGGHNFYDYDFADSNQCLQHFSFTTGIEPKHLLSSP